MKARLHLTKQVCWPNNRDKDRKNSIQFCSDVIAAVASSDRKVPNNNDDDNNNKDNSNNDNDNNNNNNNNNNNGLFTAFLPSSYTTVKCFCIYDLNAF